MSGRMNNLVSARYDLAHGAPPVRTYIVASSYRCGSTHLCHTLWKTGVLGAPLEYLNYENNMRPMSTRLGAKDPADYVAKLLACRTTRNGVFGLKAHFQHFRAALRRLPGMLEMMPRLEFIQILRKDDVAQAVSMAKALQIQAWISLTPPKEIPLFYSRELIEACSEQIRKQTDGWKRWFDSNKVNPLVVYYEDLLADRENVVNEIVRFVGAEGDEADLIAVPDVERQGDQVNAEWVGRFRAESDAAGEKRRQLSYPAG